MPFITGFGFIPITAVTPSGDFSFNGGTNSYDITANVVNPVAGGLLYSYDCAGVLELFDGVGNPLGFIEVINLPIDFEITGIAGGQAVNNLTTPPASPAVIFNPSFFQDWIFANLASSVPGWDGDINNWDAAFTEFLYNPFTVSYDVSSPIGTNFLAFGAEVNSTAYEIPPIPTNVLIFTFSGTFEEGTPPTNPVTNPVLNTTTPSITVTPPTNATTITVTTPTTTITTNATPAVPVTVVIPPGTTVVSIIPGPTGGSPPPLIVPIDLDVEADGMTTDLALAPSMVLIGNPSGIYTLVPNQRFDVLYERALGTTTVQTVAIPRPYGVTAYVPESD